MTNTDISTRGRAINIIIFTASHSSQSRISQVSTHLCQHLLTHKPTSNTTADLEWPMETSLRGEGMRLSCRRAQSSASILSWAGVCEHSRGSKGCASVQALPKQTQPTTSTLSWNFYPTCSFSVSQAQSFHLEIQG